MIVTAYDPDPTIPRAYVSALFVLVFTVIALYRIFTAKNNEEGT